MDTHKEAESLAVWLEGALLLVLDDPHTYVISAKPNACNYKPIPSNTLAPC